MYPRSRYGIFLAYCASKCMFQLNGTLSGLNIKEHLLTLFHTLCCFDKISFPRLLLSQVSQNLLNKNTLRWYHELRTRM